MATKMQKARSAIKILAVLILMSSYSFSQKKIEGLYCIDYDLKGVSTCLDFDASGNFFYSNGTDVGRRYYGEGQYKFSGNDLILDYNKTAPLKMSYHVSEIWESNKDSITVDFQLFDFDGNPATGIDIFYVDSLSQNGSKTVVYNENGVNSFKLKRENKDLQFGVSSSDYGLTTSILHSIYYLTIYKEWNYRISIYLQKSYTGIPILNKTDSLNIVKMRRNYFVVKNMNSSETVWRKLKDETKKKTDD